MKQIIIAGHSSSGYQQVKAKIQARKIAKSALFDAEWYLQQNPDICNSPMFVKKPALYYLPYGISEGRDLSSGFSNWRYLNHNPDVARTGINPLLQYICHGKKEGRSL